VERAVTRYKRNVGVAGLRPAAEGSPFETAIDDQVPRYRIADTGNGRCGPRQAGAANGNRYRRKRPEPFLPMEIPGSLRLTNLRLTAFGAAVIGIRRTAGRRRDQSGATFDDVDRGARSHLDFLPTRSSPRPSRPSVPVDPL